jgi:hypothetical protein
MEKWNNPLLTLGERCVAFAENEMNNGVKEDHPGSFTSPRIREYFSICTRLVNGKETKVNFTKGNWCAASVSFCMSQCILPGEHFPHECRLGVVEIVSDLQHNGLWKTKQDVINNNYNIKIGDLIIFDRSQPGKPETAWWRHIGRVYSVTNDNFSCISGNSGGCWKISNHNLSQPNLLGFGQYPSFNENYSGTINLIDWNNVPIEKLAPMQDTGSDLEADNFFDFYKNEVAKI